MEYADEEGFLYFFQYPVEGDGGEFLPVATTRPETILGDTAVAVNPNDERYKHLVGKQCVVPHRCVLRVNGGTSVHTTCVGSSLRSVHEGSGVWTHESEVSRSRRIRRVSSMCGWWCWAS